MATKPTKLPQWAALSDGSDNDVVDGVSGKNNVVEPTLGQKELGWTFKQFPPRQFFNWLARLTFQWLKYVDDSINQELNTTSSPTFAGATIDGGDLNIAAGDKLNVVGTGSITILESGDVKSQTFRVLDSSDVEQGRVDYDGSTSVDIKSFNNKSISIEPNGSGNLILQADAGFARLRSGSGSETFIESPTGGLIQLNSNDGTYEMLFLPTSAPSGSNRLWNDGGTLKITP
jgi:hypothetical protein